jgi:hypothetical protein
MHLDIFHNTIPLISISKQDTGKVYAQNGDVSKLVQVATIGGENCYSNMREVYLHICISVYAFAWQ